MDLFQEEFCLFKGVFRYLPFLLCDSVEPRWRRLSPLGVVFMRKISISSTQLTQLDRRHNVYDVSNAEKKKETLVLRRYRRACAVTTLYIRELAGARHKVIRTYARGSTGASVCATSGRQTEADSNQFTSEVLLCIHVCILSLRRKITRIDFLISVVLNSILLYEHCKSVIALITAFFFTSERC